MRKFLFLCLVALFGGTLAQAQTQKLISPVFWQAGVQAIHQEEMKGTTVFSFTTFRHFFINLEAVNLNAYQLHRTGSHYRLVAKDPKVGLGTYLADVTKAGVFLTTSRYKGLLKDAPSSLIIEDAKITILLAAVLEIEDSSLPRFNYEYYVTQSSGACSFSNTYYSIGWGVNTAGAIAHLNHVIRKNRELGAFHSCVALSTQPETHCLFMGCFATFAWCCTN
ncbi:hypothetical protein [Flavobacterium sp.]|jgi:hypothetical protein|uniref:hypothetical protein n=1 Tax=Flavobacterium sp. TaxID=239 RepID=UPI0022C01012|nr:hypothetical protein [Flavobacterium sp.]MCZ8143748.1 hypothetical protein [Flavobacterium sp.]MCZ8368320.1 hypothetical protein [Flavobacterium sp.]